MGLGQIHGHKTDLRRKIIRYTVAIALTLLVCRPTALRLSQRRPIDILYIVPSRRSRLEDGPGPRSTTYFKNRLNLLVGAHNAIVDGSPIVIAQLTQLIARSWSWS